MLKPGVSRETSIPRRIVKETRMWAFAVTLTHPSEPMKVPMGVWGIDIGSARELVAGALIPGAGFPGVIGAAKSPKRHM